MSFLRDGLDWHGLTGRGGFALTGVPVLCLLIACCVTWAPYLILSGSMSPNLQPGDYVIATQTFATPARGDIVVFAHPVTGVAFIKRVIGLPGDRVRMRDGQVILNRTPLSQEPGPDRTEPNRPTAIGTRPRCVAPAPGGAPCANHAAHETMPGGPTVTVLGIGRQPLADTVEITVSEDHFYFPGDNRDNSPDRRIAQARGGPGMVPPASVAGRVRLVLYSQEGRPGRLLRRVE